LISICLRTGRSERNVFVVVRKGVRDGVECIGGWNEGAGSEAEAADGEESSNRANARARLDLLGLGTASPEPVVKPEGPGAADWTRGVVGCSTDSTFVRVPASSTRSVSLKKDTAASMARCDGGGIAAPLPVVNIEWGVGPSLGAFLLTSAASSSSPSWNILRIRARDAADGGASALPAPVENPAEKLTGAISAG
jgi:hypothetical protein